MQTQKRSTMSDELQRSIAKARSLRGLKPEQIEIRVEEDRGRATRIVREERHNVAVPNALKGEVHHLFVKCNISFTLADETIVDEKVLGQLLVIAFHKSAKTARGITGLPVSKAAERKLRKEGFTHVTIHALPREHRDEVAGDRGVNLYDERRFGISFYKPKAGHRDTDARGGELVEERYDELSVLQWLYENGLEPLFQVRALSGNGLLPMTDEERERKNAIAAQAQMAFGRPMIHPEPEGAFHRTRLLARLTAIHLENVEDWDEEEKHDARLRAVQAFQESVVGRRTAEQFSLGTFSTQEFFLDERRGFAYGIFNLPDTRYIMAADCHRKQFAVQPLPVDMNGNEVLEVFGRRLEGDGFNRINWTTFSSFALGMGLLL